MKDFFAMASSNDIRSTTPQMGSTGQSAFTSVSIMNTPPQMPSSTMMSQGQHPVPITALPISQGLAMGAVPVAGYPIYQSQPHLLPTTVHPLQVSSGAIGLHPPTSTSINPMVQRLISNPGIHSVESIEAEQRRSTSPSMRNSTSPNDHTMVPTTKKLTDLESELKQKLHIGNNQGKIIPTNDPFVNDEKNNQPTLLSPHAFSGEKSQSLKINGHNEFGNPKASITPLTQEQMVEAFSYLLENEPDFVNKLHHAYIMSVNKKFQILK